MSPAVASCFFSTDNPYSARVMSEAGEIKLVYNGKLMFLKKILEEVFAEPCTAISPNINAAICPYIKHKDPIVCKLPIYEKTTKSSTTTFTPVIFVDVFCCARQPNLRIPPANLLAYPVKLMVQGKELNDRHVLLKKYLITAIQNAKDLLQEKT
jgi:hypothetical protein